MYGTWDDKLNKYYDPLDIDANGFRARIKEQNYNFDLFANDLKKDNLIFEQYTGVNDSNGKPIYEGDLLLVECDGQKRVVSIGFHNGAFRLEDGPMITSLFEIINIDTNNFEYGVKATVVGDIHEH